MPLLRLGRPLMPASAIPGGTRAQRRIAPNGSEIHQGYLLNIESFLRRLANWAIWTAARAPVRAAYRRRHRTRRWGHGPGATPSYAACVPATADRALVDRHGQR